VEITGYLKNADISSERSGIPYAAHRPDPGSAATQRPNECLYPLATIKKFIAVGQERWIHEIYNANERSDGA
jgi:hypothetical protein